MLALIVSISAAVADPAGASADPLAPAAEGRLQCYQPDDRARTCLSIASYRRLEGSNYASVAQVLVSPSGPAVLETATPVKVKDGAVCGTIRKEDLAAGSLRVGGRVLDAAEAAPHLARLAQAMAPLLDKEICTAYQPSAKGLIAKASIDGVYQAWGDQPVKWVTPGEGYTVSP